MIMLQKEQKIILLKVRMDLLRQFFHFYQVVYLTDHTQDLWRSLNFLCGVQFIQTQRL